MTCPFCGKSDSQTGERHYELHQVEYLQRIAKALESLDKNFDYWLSDFAKKRAPEL